MKDVGKHLNRPNPGGMPSEVVRNRLTSTALRRALPVVAVLTIAAAAVGYFWAESAEPTYTATGVVELIDDTAGTSTSDVSFEDLEAQRRIVQSNDMRQALNTSLGADASAVRSVSAATSEDTTLLTIKATAGNARTAVLATNTLLDLFAERRVADQRAEFNTQLAEATQKVTEQAASVASITADLEAATTPSEAREHTLRQQNAVNRLQTLEAALQEIDSEVALADGRLNIIDRPVIAAKSARNPPITAAAFGAVILLLSIGTVTFLSSRNRTIKLVDELDDIFPGIDVLATVPKFRKQFRARTNAIVIGQPDAMREAEAFRFLRTALELATDNKEAYSVAITSTGPGEGKTVTSANLAVSMAGAGSRTLLVDGDLLSPSLPELAGRPESNNALPQLLRGAAVEELVTMIGDDDGLHVLINEGVERAPERVELAPARMRQAFKELTDSYQAVVVDCPPALVVADAVAISAAADFTIVVARLGQVRRRDLIRTIEQLRQADANVLGIIATHAGGKGDGYGGYGSYDYYGSSATKGRKR